MNLYRFRLDYAVQSSMVTIEAMDEQDAALTASTAFPGPRAVFVRRVGDVTGVLVDASSARALAERLRVECGR